jgi:hypothetical protein
MERQPTDKDAESPEQGDEDEFFGSQDDEGEFGALGQHDDLAKDHALKTIGYFESYDETKDILLQEGFEAGYRETYDAALRVGKLFGKLSAETQLLSGKTTESESKQSSEAARRLHEFLTEFQNRPKNVEVNAKESIELLEQELSRSKEG